LAEGAGNQVEAIEALRLALVQDPESPQLRISYAEVLARAGRLTAAEAEARRAVELAGPGQGAAPADAQRVLGKVLLARGRIGAAEEALLRATRIEAERVRSARAAPSEELEEGAIDPEAWRVLADARLRRSDAAAAQATGEDLAKIDPVAGAGVLRELAGSLLEANDAARAELAARRATELARSDGAGWKLLSRAQEEQGHLDQARRSIEQALVDDPSDPEALLSAGQLSLHQGDLAAARGWFQQLLRVAPDEGTAQLRVASSWLDSKRPGEALEVVAAADSPEALYLRGVALSRLRRWPEAVAVLERIGAGTSELHASACALRGTALSRLGRSEEAIRVLRDGATRAPRDPTLLFALGEAYDRAGQRDAALAQMRAVLRVNPEQAEAMNYLGYAYAEGNERLEEAEALLTRALRAEPDNAYYLDSLGWILYKRRDLGRAVETLERAATLAPEMTILDHLGDAYRAAQRPAAAAGAYRRALQSGDPDDEEPGLTAAARRTLLQEKLEELGAHDGRAANLRR
jgi:tetratricopeptide (TPR) repeat protein